MHCQRQADRPPPNCTSTALAYRSSETSPTHLHNLSGSTIPHSTIVQIKQGLVHVEITRPSNAEGCRFDLEVIMYNVPAHQSGPSPCCETSLRTVASPCTICVLSKVQIGTAGHLMARLTIFSSIPLGVEQNVSSQFQRFPVRVRK